MRNAILSIGFKIYTYIPTHSGVKSRAPGRMRFVKWRLLFVGFSLRNLRLATIWAPRIFR
jgi:hypothetical protein